ncbi:MAG: hypothetical protein ABI843_05270 [Dokdonella sp.]
MRALLLALAFDRWQGHRQEIARGKQIVASLAPRFSALAKAASGLARAYIDVVDDTQTKAPATKP